MARETNEELGHSHESDGIEEYDNPLPDWWLGLFFVTIIFAAVYPIWYHGMEGHTQVAAYDLEMAAAAVTWPEREALASLPTDAATVAAGEEIFLQTCASCHLADLTGKIGPNLIDAEWIHGSTGPEILKTISEGVAAKGMPAWGPILGPAKVEQVAAFVLSKQGSAPVHTPAAPAPEEVEAPEKPVEALEEGAEAAEIDAAALFATNCAVCHKPDMTGLVGPNLIDDEWIHGGSLEEIEKTITNGVLEKSMIAWGPTLGPEKIAALARYVQSKGEQAAE